MKIKKNCIQCKKEFSVIPSLSRVSHCSRSCGAKTQAEKLKSKPHKKLIEINCLQCSMNCFVTRGNKKKGYGKFCSSKCYGSWLAKNSIGEKSPHWRGGVTTPDQMERTKFRKEIQGLVLERDNYTCRLCHIRGGKLQVDHMKSWSKYFDLRFDMNNCRTLCMACHYKITFGRELPKGVRTWGHNFSQSGWVIQ